MKNGRFKVGSGCFTCHACGKQTRATGGRHRPELELCVLCQVKCESGNELSDAGFAGDAWQVFEACQSVVECEKLLAATKAAL